MKELSETPEAATGRQKRVLFFGLLLVLVLTGICFLPKYTSFFTRDDFVWLDYAGRGLGDIFSTNISGFFMPVPKLFFLVGFKLFGLRPAPFNVVTLLLHMANVLLLAWFIYALTKKEIASVAGSAVFAISYPAYETVSWISAVVWEILTLFFLCALLSYFYYRRQQKEGQARRAWLYILAIVFSILALFTKEAVVTLPVVILLLEWIVIEDIARPGRWERMKQGIIFVIPFFVITIAYGIAQILVQSENQLVQTGKWSFGGHIFTNILKYMNWLVLVPPDAPHGSSFFAHGAGHLMLTVFQIAGFIILPLVFVLIIVKGNRIERFAVSWIVITLVPVVMFNGEPSSRYVYLPAVGFAILFGEVLAVRVREGLKNKQALRAICAAAMTVFIVLSAAGLYLGARRFAGRTDANRNVARQLKQIDGQYSKGQKIKIKNVPEVVLGQVEITSTVNLYSVNLKAAQDLPDSTEGLIVYKYTEPNGLMIRVK